MTLVYKGSVDFRQRIVLSLLSGKKVRIEDIRVDDPDAPGVRACEAGFLRLLSKVSSGSRVEIDASGTSVQFVPGVISGGKYLTHDCGKSRAIGYYLEPLICVALFAKNPIGIELSGVTNDNVDMSVDMIRTVTLPILSRFNVDCDQLQLKVARRGARPNGAGIVQCTLPNVRSELGAVNLVDAVDLRVRRVRGIAYSARVSPAMGNRAIEGARSVLNRFVKDVFIYSDHFKGAESGASPGYGVTLVAESADGQALVASELFAETGERQTADELGERVAKQLLVEIMRSGVVDSSNQWLALLLMSLTPRHVSRIRLGPLTAFSIRYLRLINDFLGVRFKITEYHRQRRSKEASDSSGEDDSQSDDDDDDDDDEENPHFVLACVGCGIRNLARRVS
jgi:RNA 3'-terminal phosphate cyclase-like protein